MIFCHFGQQGSEGALDRTLVLQTHVPCGIFNLKKQNQLLPPGHIFGTRFS